MNEKRLAKKLRQQDSQAFNDVIQQYSKLLWYVAGSVLSSASQTRTAEIEECVSDVFLHLWRYPEKFQPERGSLKNYLALRTKSQALNRLRSVKRDNIVDIEDYYLEAVEDILMDLVTEEAVQELFQNLMQLSEPIREICIRRYIFDEKPQVICEKMKLAKKEVENGLYRGKQKLKKLHSNSYEMEGKVNGTKG